MRDIWLPYQENAETAPFIDAWKAAERVDIVLWMALQEANKPPRQPWQFKERVRLEFRKVSAPPAMPKGKYRLAWPAPKATGTARKNLHRKLSHEVWAEQWERSKAQDKFI